MTLRDKRLSTAVAVVGAIAFGIFALSRGEPVSAAWLVIAAACVYFIAYRFYARSSSRARLASTRRARRRPYRHNDGIDYVPTDRRVLFGHHFAAIAGAGPLVGPVLATQMGYLPGSIWIVVGAVFAGACRTIWCCGFRPGATAVPWARCPRRTRAGAGGGAASASSSS